MSDDEVTDLEHMSRVLGLSLEETDAKLTMYELNRNTLPWSKDPETRRIVRNCGQLDVEEIACLLGVSLERSTQILRSAMRKVRNNILRDTVLMASLPDYALREVLGSDVLLKLVPDDILVSVAKEVCGE